MLFGAGTLSYFSDTEISYDNQFIAGLIDLKVDCHSTHMRTFPEPYDFEEPIVFGETDLIDEKFFYWDDIKPGDYGEATLSFHLYNNDGWGWFHILNVEGGPGLTPESEPTPDLGELPENINIFVWIDDGAHDGFGNDPKEWDCDGKNGCPDCCDGGEGDNIYQEGYEDIIFTGTMADLYPYDCCWNGPFHMENCTTYYIGWYWEIPAEVGNEIQGDWFEFDIEFYVEQYRNNPNPIPPGPPCGDAEVDIEIEKTVDNPRPEIGTNVEFTITATNLGPDDASNVIVEDILPDGLIYYDHTTTHGTYDESTGIWSIGSLSNGGTAELSLFATVDMVPPSNEFTQLAMILDGSGSISGADWGIMLEGLASAIENPAIFPQDSSVELTVIQFGGNPSHARIEIMPTIITNANYGTIANDIRGISKMGGWTPMACGILLAADTLAASAEFDPTYRQIINLVTDGEPNRCCHNDGDYDSDLCDSVTAKQSVQNARDYLLTTLGMTDDQDEFDAEAVGDGPDGVWLRDHVVWPQPGYDNWPPTGPGWVRHVANYTEFAETIGEKFQLVFQSITNCAELVSCNPSDAYEANNEACATVTPISYLEETTQKHQIE